LFQIISEFDLGERAHQKIPAESVYWYVGLWG